MAVEVKNPNKDKLLEAAIASIQKNYGKGSIMKLGESIISTVPTEVIPTGSLALDIATGVGGVPRGRIIEIYGPESSGKTTLAFHIIANAQKGGGVAAFVDVEHAMDPKYISSLGVNVDELYVSQPDAGEEALDIVETLVKTGVVDVIVLDSVAALVTRAELEGAIGDSHVGQQARLMSQALRKITALASKSRTTVVFINQLRDKIGNSYGPTETTTGGRALKFFSSMRLDIRRTEAIKLGDTTIGNAVKVKVAKNKLAPPFQVAEFDIIYGEGISKELELLALAEKYKLVDKSGSWYSYKGAKIGQGSDNARKFIRDNPDVSLEIENSLLSQLMPNRMIASGKEKHKTEDEAPAPARRGRKAEN